MIMADKLDQEELDLQKLTKDDSEVIFDLSNTDEDLIKQFIKKVIRYKTDTYVVIDPHKDDPIIIPDTSIDDNIDFFVDEYKEVINIPYLDMNKYLSKIRIARKTLKYNDLLLHTRKQLAKVDLGMTNEDRESYFDINVDSGDILDYNKISKDQQTNKTDIEKTDGSRLLVEYLIRMRYGGKDMSQIDLIIEKLNFDIKNLNEGTDINKEKNIKDINNALDVISCVGDVEIGENYLNTKWYSYFIETIVYDARAVKIVKEIASDPARSRIFIEKIFGPDMMSAFEKKFSSTVNYTIAPTDVFIKSSVVLMFYTMAKKIKSYMKSKNCRSLIYRGYIIHYMLDELTDSQLLAMNNLFKDLFDLYLSNEKLTKILRKNSFYESMLEESIKA